MTRDLLAFQLVAGELGPNHALLIIAPAGAERVPQLAVRDLGVCRRGGDKQDAVFRIDVGGGHRHAGVEVADHELDAIAHQLVGDRHPLLGVRNVVDHFDLDLLPQNAAGLVDVFGGLLDALSQLSAEGRIGSGDRSGDGEFELRVAPPASNNDRASGMDFRMAVRMLTP
jgi:hypothetical protein